MSIYKYHDNFHQDWLDKGHPGKIIYQCEADNILQADIMFCFTCSIDAVKSPWIGIEVI